MTEERIREMSRDELEFRAYELASSDMETALNFSDKEIMDFQVMADSDTLRDYLIDFIEFFDDDVDTTFYRGYTVSVINGKYEVHIDSGVERFATFCEAVEYIDAEADEKRITEIINQYTEALDRNVREHETWHNNGRKHGDWDEVKAVDEWFERSSTELKADVVKAILELVKGE